MIYVASPYSHIDPHVRQERYEAVAALCAHFFHQPGHEPLFSPIVYGHNLALEYSMPTEAAAWLKFNLSMLRHSSAIWIMKLDGWNESKGVAKEIRAAQDLYLPLHFIDHLGRFIL